MSSRPFRELPPSHFRGEENYIDPDDGNSWTCGACKLPIFSTPFIKSYIDDTNDDDNNNNDNNRKVTFLHDQCANLPKELKGSLLHPGSPLMLDHNNTTHADCFNCRAKCGSTLYYCPDPHCSIKLDVLCALPSSITISHRCHEHRMMAIRHTGLLSSLICYACGARHPRQAGSTSWSVSYMCHACNIWIHPSCASLPNIIVLQYPEHHHHHHQHPLVLYYLRGVPQSLLLPEEDKGPSDCAICQRPIEGLGFYSCAKCGYYVHIMCAVSDPHSFKPVLIRDARLPHVVRLPIPDEHTSVVRYIIDSTTSSSDHPHDDELVLPLDQLHEHPLIFHDDNDDDDDDNDQQSRVCDACVQLIISPPFYRCSECPDFFLHNCCARLPSTITQHRAHYAGDPLSLLPKRRRRFLKSINEYVNCCNYPTNGFTYACEDCHFYMDVQCALMPASITHDAHSKMHILYSSYARDRFRSPRCDCCGESGSGLFYQCGTCRNFTLHSKCALLPNTVSLHRFDPHPLKLITTTSNHKWTEKSSSSSSSTGRDSTPAYSYGHQLKVLICEICEEDISNREWYYSCDECDQSFHIDCIPCLDGFSKIKLGSDGTPVGCHGRPLTLIRGLKVLGRARCMYRFCRRTYRKDAFLAFECSKCGSRFHIGCAFGEFGIEDVD